MSGRQGETARVSSLPLLRNGAPRRGVTLVCIETAYLTGRCVMSSHTTLLLRMSEASLTAPPAFAFCQEHVAEGAPLNEADFCGDPPLVLAAGNGHLAVVKFLIDEGADLQQCGLMRDTPLHRAAHNGHLQTVKYLLEEGAELDALDVGDNTALHWASMRGHVEIVKELLEQGADKTITNNEDKLPVDLCQAFWSPAWQFTRAVLED